MVGLPFMWLVDMISIIVKGHIPWFKYYKEDTLIEEIKHQREMRELEKQKQAEEDEKPKYNFKR